ncbi:MAG: hypothetical protein ACREPE_13225, partial [Lysobacter sp.]
CKAAIRQLRVTQAAHYGLGQCPLRRIYSVTNYEVPPLLDQVANSVSQAIAYARPELAGADPVIR